MTRNDVAQLLSEHLSFLMALEQLELPAPAGFEDIQGLPDTARSAAVQRNQHTVKTYAYRAQLTQKLREVVEECRSGNCARGDILGDLADTSHLGVTLAQLGCTYDEIQRWHRMSFVQRVRTALDALRAGQYQGNGDLLNEIDAIMQVQPWNPPITYSELGTSQEELDRFRQIQGLLP